MVVRKVIIFFHAISSLGQLCPIFCGSRNLWTNSPVMSHTHVGGDDEQPQFCFKLGHVRRCCSHFGRRHWRCAHCGDEFGRVGAVRYACQDTFRDTTGYRARSKGGSCKANPGAPAIAADYREAGKAHCGRVALCRLSATPKLRCGNRVRRSPASNHRHRRSHSSNLWRSARGAKRLARARRILLRLHSQLLYEIAPTLLLAFNELGGQFRCAGVAHHQSKSQSSLPNFR